MLNLAVHKVTTGL